MNRIIRNTAGVVAMAIALMALTPGLAIAQKKGGGGAGAGNRSAGNVQKPSTGNIQKPTTKAAPASAQGGRDNFSSKSNSVNQNTVSGNRTGNSNSVGNKTNNVGNKTNIGSGNNNNININVDNSKDIRVNNSRNTAVVRPPAYRPYPRPPYRYGGHVYFCYHPYYYHPYTPFMWGPMWHPWGFFVATLATTAIIVSIVDNDLPDYPVAVNMSNPGILSGPYSSMMVNGNGQLVEVPLGQDYYYDEGVFYLKVDGGYTVVAGPVGAVVPKLPKGYETAKLDDGTTNYYFAGTFYVKVDKGYKVVAPTAGTVVEHLPDGGEEVTLGDIKYVKLGEIYFQPIQQDGKNVYEIASVEEDK